MPDSTDFAEKARRCRELIGRTTNSYVAEQLRQWADEFEAMAQRSTALPPLPDPKLAAEDRSPGTVDLDEPEPYPAPPYTAPPMS